jgi:2-dehydro-3-deoxyphosphooctonate aldolase (KDO 8-P synthase)
MTAIPAMQSLGCPVVMDATHSTQQPGGLGLASAGNRDLAPILARAAVAAGADGLFMEVHPTPDKALCDAACMIPLDWVEGLLRMCKTIHTLVRPTPPTNERQHMGLDGNTCSGRFRGDWGRVWALTPFR